jgi:hypothetical protein
MKYQNSWGPHLGKLIHQLPGGVTFAYDLRFRHTIARWKGIIEEIHFGENIEGTYIFLTIFPKNIVYGLKTTLEVKNC